MKHIFRALCKTFKLSDINSKDTNLVNTVLTLLRDKDQGLPFVCDEALPECSFIAIEAIWWSIERCDDIQNEQTALLLFQVNETV